MARVEITPVALTAISSDGHNLTDQAFTTMATGAGNGVNFAFDAKDLIVLKNTTGGAAVYSLILRSVSGVTDLGGSLTDPTVTVAAGKTHVIRATDILQQSDGDVYIDCDVAGDIVVLNL